jgi:hypothetical protein
MGDLSSSMLLMIMAIYAHDDSITARSFYSLEVIFVVGVDRQCVPFRVLSVIAWADKTAKGKEYLVLLIVATINARKYSTAR